MSGSYDAKRALAESLKTIMRKAPFSRVTVDGVCEQAKDVTGATVNGKGEESQVEAKGILVADALAQSGIDWTSVQQVTVKASDEFYAVLTAAALAQPAAFWTNFHAAGRWAVSMPA